MSEIVLPNIDIVTLANSTVSTPEGQQLRVGQLWKSQPVIFIFLRHFACIGCRAHAAQVWKDRQKYERSGTKLIFIGNGQPNFIEKFKTDMGMEKALVLTDPSLETFRAAGFRRGFFYVVQMRTAVNALKLMANGHRQASYSKDAGTHWQLGGILAVNTQGQILYHYISESLGDFPEEPNFALIQADESLSR